jgi:prepilin-type processing-associated H-X9-DG protein
LSSAKKRAQGIQCISNLKQMTLGWQLYTDEQSDHYPPNACIGNVHFPVGEDEVNPSWVAGSMDMVNGLNAIGVDDNTNTAKLTGAAYAKFGSIGVHVKAAQVYHCPGDFNVDPVSYEPAVRSISMNGWINPGITNGCNVDCWSAPFKKFTRSTDFVGASPSEIFCFVDERHESINDGWLWVSVTGYNADGTVDINNVSVNDQPAIYHNRASAFSFADGHAQMHKWNDSDFDNNDIIWLMTHATVPEKNN